MSGDMDGRDLIYAAIAIPVVSLLAITITKRLMKACGWLWRWFVKGIAGQTAEAIRDVMAPELGHLQTGLMGAMEELRDTNARDHVEVQIRLSDVEVRLHSVEQRLAAVEATLMKGPEPDAVAD